MKSMKTKLYVVRDEVSGICTMPNDAINDQVAARKFNEMRKEWPNPKEYSLICVGELQEDQLTIIPDIYIVIQGKANDHLNASMDKFKQYEPEAYQDELNPVGELTEALRPDYKGV